MPPGYYEGGFAEEEYVVLVKVDFRKQFCEIKRNQVGMHLVHRHISIHPLTCAGRSPEEEAE